MNPPTPTPNTSRQYLDASRQRETHRYKQPDGSFDARDMVTRIFDAAERVKSETNADGHITSYQYDAAANGTVSYAFQYDRLNRLTYTKFRLARDDFARAPTLSVR